MKLKHYRIFRTSFRLFSLMIPKTYQKNRWYSVTDTGKMVNQYLYLAHTVRLAVLFRLTQCMKPTNATLLPRFRIRVTLVYSQSEHITTVGHMISYVTYHKFVKLGHTKIQLVAGSVRWKPTQCHDTWLTYLYHEPKLCTELPTSLSQQTTSDNCKWKINQNFAELCRLLN